jgi:hypothetical protein
MKKWFRFKEKDAKFIVFLIVFYLLLFAAWALFFGKLFGDALSLKHLRDG